MAPDTHESGVNAIKAGGSFYAYQSRQNLFQSDPPFSSHGFVLLDCDPPLVEAVEH